jgi:pre-mRNA-splicing factor 38A
MANVTDPLAGAVHGTDPQNLMEYITRQRIYDCRYWKEECFGLTAADVLEKATKLTCYGASFGGNSQPTKFLCLVLKLLQIQPPQDLMDSFVQTEEFKYVRALGAFYKRLTARPADVYETLEPLYTDYSKLRYRDVTEWKLHTMDQLIHQLLHDDRVCGISLTRLPSRESLERDGYLEAKYKSPILHVVGTRSLEEYLYTKVLEGSLAAKALWEARKAIRTAKEYNRQDRAKSTLTTSNAVRNTQSSINEDTLRSNERRADHARLRNVHDSVAKRARVDKKKDNAKYGALFKSAVRKEESSVETNVPTVQGAVTANSEEYWNEQRAALGLKPLRKN